MRRKPLLLAVLLLLLGAVQAQQLAPNAPKDKPVEVNRGNLSALEQAIQPHVAEARRTWPAAKQRYLAGLQPGQSFFVTARLRDGRGMVEQVFVAVRSIEGDTIQGRIASDINIVQGYKRGDTYSLKEAALVDWLIANPDGSEEGNYVGKFLDTWQAR
jgi:hypothetical protein